MIAWLLCMNFIDDNVCHNVKTLDTPTSLPKKTQVQKPLGTPKKELAYSVGLLQAQTWKPMKSEDLEERSQLLTDVELSPVCRPPAMDSLVRKQGSRLIETCLLCLAL